MVLIGGRLGEMPSQSYTLIDIPAPQQTLVHVHPGAEELGRVYRPHLAIKPRRPAFAAALEGLQPPNEIAWREQTESRARRLSRLDREGDASCPATSISARSWCGCASSLPPKPSSATAPATSPAWMHRFYRFRHFGAALSRRPRARWATACRRRSAMKRLYPERTVVCIAGDGDFLMNGQEFATAVQYDLPIIVVICDNGTYGTIRMHQEREYPGRVVGTELQQSGFRRVCAGPSAASARRSRRPADFAQGLRGGARSPASPRSSMSRSIPTRSRRRPRSTRSAQQALAEQGR